MSESEAAQYFYPSSFSINSYCCINNVTHQESNSSTAKKPVPCLLVHKEGSKMLCYLVAIDICRQHQAYEIATKRALTLYI
jgi:hypothetical protein